MRKIIKTRRVRHGYSVAKMIRVSLQKQWQLYIFFFLIDCTAAHGMGGGSIQDAGCMSWPIALPEDANWSVEAVDAMQSS
jgi:hypothetical protein